MPRNIGIAHDSILVNFISRGSLDTSRFKKAQPFFIFNRAGNLLLSFRVYFSLNLFLYS